MISKKVIKHSDKKYTEDEISSMLNSALSETSNDASIHFGQPYFNTATIAGCYRMVIKKLAKEHGVSL